jgi:hypothetical protein
MGGKEGMSKHDNDIVYNQLLLIRYCIMLSIVCKNGLHPNAWAQQPNQENWGMGGEGCIVTHHMI